MKLGPRIACHIPPSARPVQFVENTPWLNTLQWPFLARMTIRDILARNLRTYRQARGLSQEELAHRADIDRTYISSIERCQYAASIDVLERLARELGVRPAELLDEGDEKA